MKTLQNNVHFSDLSQKQQRQNILMYFSRFVVEIVQQRLRERCSLHVGTLQGIPRNGHQIDPGIVRFEVFMAVSMKNAIF
jgi:hypothetical protein